MFVRYRSFTVLIVFVCMCGCSKADPDCAANDAKNLVLRIAKEHSSVSPAAVLSRDTASAKAFRNKQQSETADLMSKARAQCNGNAGCLNQARIKIDNDSAERAQSEGERVLAAAIYSLDTIRLTGRDDVTRAATCAANLQVQFPDQWGNDEAQITYKLEITSDGKLYATVRGLP